MFDVYMNLYAHVIVVEYPLSMIALAFLLLSLQDWKNSGFETFEVPHDLNFYVRQERHW